MGGIRAETIRFFGTFPAPLPLEFGQGAVIESRHSYVQKNGWRGTQQSEALMSMHHDMRRPIAAMCVTAGTAPIGSGAGIVSSQIQIHRQHGGEVRRTYYYYFQVHHTTERGEDNSKLMLSDDGESPAAKISGGSQL